MRANQQLTAIVACLLIVLLAVEGATLLQIRALLTVHAFVGILLIPVAALKLASVGRRMLGYYRGHPEYVAAGPPHLALRAFVAPVIVVSTIVLLATGVALLALDRAAGTVALLHKASFIVWFGAAAVHVLVHVWKLPSALRERLPGTLARVALASASVAAGAALAVVTLPAADRLQDQVSAQVGLDPY